MVPFPANKKGLMEVLGPPTPPAAPSRPRGLLWSPFPPCDVGMTAPNAASAAPGPVPGHALPLPAKPHGKILPSSSSLAQLLLPGKGKPSMASLMEKGGELRQFWLSVCWWLSQPPCQRCHPSQGSRKDGKASFYSSNSGVPLDIH